MNTKDYLLNRLISARQEIQNLRGSLEEIQKREAILLSRSNLFDAQDTELAAAYQRNSDLKKLAERQHNSLLAFYRAADDWNCAVGARDKKRRLSALHCAMARAQECLEGLG